MMTIDRGLLKDFETFLLNLGSVPKDKVKFYIYWVWRFLKSYHYQLDSIHPKSVSQSLDSLEADEKIADWQVISATEAVILYVKKYLKKSFQHNIPDVNESGEKSNDSKEKFLNQVLNTTFHA